MTVGQLYFAYVNPLTVFNGAIHNVEDEKLLSVRISQTEGEFAQAEMEIENPYEGLLNPARKQNIFISANIDNVVTLLFSGRIVGFPEDPTDSTIVLRAIAQPEDWFDTQNTFIQTLKVAPYYNTLFTPEEQRNDPAEILAARSALFHWHRATGALTLSDIIQGANTIDLDDDFLADSLDMRIGDPPLAGVDVSLEVQWNQIGVGVVNAGAAITAEFGNEITVSPVINTLTPIAFEKAWQGVKIPTGYSVAESALNPIANGFGLVKANLRSGNATVAGADYPTATGATPASRLVSVPRVWYVGRLKLDAVYEQKRRETLASAVNIAAQELSLSNNKRESISIRLQDPTAEAQSAVLDRREPSFFMDGPGFSAYGQSAIEHALLRAHARLLKSTRVLETTVEAPLQTLIGLTCDYNIRIADERIPGGSIRGKVVGYELSIDGDSGTNIGRVTFASVIGTGADSAGSGDTVGTHVYANEFGAGTMTSEIFYDLTAPPVIDEPIDVDTMESSESYLIDSVTVMNHGQSQNAGFIFNDPPNYPDVYLNDNGTRVEVSLKSMNPEAELFAEISVTASDLTLPRHTDLEA